MGSGNTRLLCVGVRKVCPCWSVCAKREMEDCKERGYMQTVLCVFRGSDKALGGRIAGVDKGAFRVGSHAESGSEGTLQKGRTSWDPVAKDQ